MISGKKNLITTKSIAVGDVKIGKILENVERTILPSGSQIGKYRIIDEIDRGGMAVVYKALQLDLNRVVALKILPANITINRRFVERFLSEAHAVARLNHPNIVSIHEVSMENNIYYLAMDYIAGKNLYYYLHETKPKLVEVLQIVVALADALSYAHEQKIVHRDLKLNNVIMDHGKRPLLIDFGLAKALEEEDSLNTRTGEIMGSPAYMAPERLLGHEADPRSDICSLGIMLYEMLTFKNPYLDPRSIHQTTLNVLESRPVSPRKLMPWLPVEVECITLKALDHYPENRYQTMEEFKDDIVRYQRGEQVSVNPPSALSKLQNYARRRWAPIAIGATIVFFLTVLTGFHLMQSRKEQWRWRLIQTHSFDAPERLSEWETEHRGLSESLTDWSVENGKLIVRSERQSFIRLKRPITRDLRFEFDVRSPDGNFFGFGFFMCGNTPQNGYTFKIHSGPEASCGISYPGSKYLHYSYNQALFPVSDRYHVIIEKVDQTFTFKLNGTVVAQITDHMPSLGKQHQRIGFFSEGGTYHIDNLKIFRRSVPLLAAPTIIADRFWEHGEFESAYNEYRELLLDFSNNEIVSSINLKMADCLIRIGRYKDADSLLRISSVQKIKDVDLMAKRLFLEAHNLASWGKQQSADSVFHLLRSRLSDHSINRFVAVSRLEHSMRLIELGSTDSAEALIIQTADGYPGLASLCGRYHLLILREAIGRKDFEKALAVSERIVENYGSHDEIVSEARVALGELYLGNKAKYKGIEHLNRSIVTLHSFPALWRGWWLLAEVYEYDHNVADAISIYEKIQKEGSKNIPISWMAKVKLAEMERTRNGINPRDSILNEVINADHPFALPRLTASLYAGKISKTGFARQWQTMYSDDQRYLYYWARRDILYNDYLSAMINLHKLLACLEPKTWEYEKISLLIQFLSVRM